MEMFSNLPISLALMYLDKFGPGSPLELVIPENQSAYSRRVYRSISRSVTDHSNAITDGAPASKILNNQIKIRNKKNPVKNW